MVIPRMYQRAAVSSSVEERIPLIGPTRSRTAVRGRQTDRIHRTVDALARLPLVVRTVCAPRKCGDGLCLGRPTRSLPELTSLRDQAIGLIILFTHLRAAWNRLPGDRLGRPLIGRLHDYRHGHQWPLTSGRGSTAARRQWLDVGQRPGQRVILLPGAAAPGGAVRAGRWPGGARER